MDAKSNFGTYWELVAGGGGGGLSGLVVEVAVGGGTESVRGQCWWLVAVVAGSRCWWPLVAELMMNY